jgi:hypothetical protein
MKNYRAFKVTYKGPTNHRGSRVIIKDLRFNQSKTINYDYKHNSISDMAIEYLESIGIKIVGRAESNFDTLLFTDNFETKLKE